MRFFEPQTVDEAIGHLAADAGNRCLAGGATLVAMMNARLVEPELWSRVRDCARPKSEVNRPAQLYSWPLRQYLKPAAP